MGAELARIAPEIIEGALVEGNLDRMSPAQRTEYYTAVCRSVGLNPLTKPFSYLRLNGKLTLYALRDATDQLRKQYKVSVRITDRSHIDGGVYIVTARATLPDGREDESTGAVPLGGLKGENLANALMKAETKAKRRVTLSICGLGWLDETEADSIPGAQRVDVDSATNGHYAASRAQLAESSALAEEQARERLRSDRWVEDVSRDIAELARDEDLFRWIRFHAVEASTLHRNAKARLWTAVQRKAKELDVAVADVRDALAQEAAEQAMDAVPAELVDEPASTPQTTPHSGEEVAVRFGRQKGITIRELVEAGRMGDVTWYTGALAASIEDPDKSRFRADNERHLEEVERVVRELQHGGEEPSWEHPDEPAFGDDDIPY